MDTNKMQVSSGWLITVGTLIVIISQLYYEISSGSFNLFTYLFGVRSDLFFYGGLISSLLRLSSSVIIQLFLLLSGIKIIRGEISIRFLNITYLFGALLFISFFTPWQTIHYKYLVSYLAILLTIFGIGIKAVNSYKLYSESALEKISNSSDINFIPGGVMLLFGIIVTVFRNEITPILTIGPVGGYGSPVTAQLFIIGIILCIVGAIFVLLNINKIIKKP